MSFSLNKLVQPECGAPNALVAAAQQITMKPSTAITSMSRLRQPIRSQPQLNFAKEFAQREIPSVTKIVNISAMSASAPVVNSHQQQHAQQHYIMRQPLTNPMMNYMTMRKTEFNQDNQVANQITSPAMAGDQLETKYRNDMISHTSGLNHGADGKLDDIEFWQTLSQQYIGPNTYNSIARLRAEKAAASTSKEQQQELTDKFDELSTEEKSVLDEVGLAETLKFNDLEYVFDERNPLKDQFENPFAEGLKRLEQGDIPSAALLFEAAVQKEPENALAWRYLGTTQAQNEKDMSAIRALKNCLNLDKTDQNARLAIAVSLANETQQHQACKYLLEWLMNHEKYKRINANLEEFHQLDSELSDDPFYMNSIADKHYYYVKDKFVAAARMSPNNPDPDVQNSLGVLFNMRGEYEKAVDCFKAALSVRSDDSLLWNRLGATLANGCKSDEAVIAYRRALEISPGFLRSRYNLAISLVHLNLYDEAAKQLVQILNMQAAGKGSKNTQIRTRSITSTSIWNTLRTVATLLNQPKLYPIIDGRDLGKCNEAIFKNSDNNN